jgi:PAS domain-containing protein
VKPDGVRAATVNRCERCAAAALDIAEAAAAGRTDELTLLRHMQLVADEMKAHAGWLRRMLVGELVEQGLTQDRIATVLGVTRQRVTTLVRQTATSSRTPPVTRLPKLAGPTADGALPAAVSWSEDVLLDTSFDRCTHGLALVDATGRLLRVNSSLAGLLQREPAELVGADYPSDESEGEVPRTLGSDATHSPSITDGARRTVWQRKDGGRIRLRQRVWPVRPPQERRLAGYAVEVWPDDGSG